MKNMTYTALESHAYNNVLVKKCFVRLPIFQVRAYTRTVICRTFSFYKVYLKITTYSIYEIFLLSMHIE